MHPARDWFSALYHNRHDGESDSAVRGGYPAVMHDYLGVWDGMPDLKAGVQKAGVQKAGVQ